MTKYSSVGCLLDGLAVIVGWRNGVRCFQRGFRVLVPARSVGLEKSVDGGVARFVHVEAVVVLKPHDQRRGDAFHVYLRSVGKYKILENARRARLCYSLLQNVLVTMTVLVFHSRYDKKLALVGAVFDTRHALQGSVFVFRQEQDETQRVARIRKQTIDVLECRVDELFAIWRIRLERASGWKKIQERSTEKTFY